MYLIIGVDPGTTTGVAAVTLDGRVHSIHSSRNMGVNRVVKHIISLGRPSLIASDVTPTPDSVLKIASSLGCAVFTLYEPLSVKDKNNLTAGHELEDLHSRDALAAALNAFNKYKNKLDKIAALGYGDDVKHKVLQGIRLERVLAEIKEQKTRKRKEAGTTIIPVKKPPAGKIQALEKQNLLLKEQIKLNEFELSQLKKQLFSLKVKSNSKVPWNQKFRQQEQVIDSLEHKTRKLEARLKEIEEMEDLWHKLASGKIVPIGVYPEIYSGVTFVKYRMSKKDVEKLMDAKMVFTEDSKNKQLLSESGIPLADPKLVQVKNNITYLPKKDYLKLVHKPVQSIESLVDEYRTQRNI